MTAPLPPLLFVDDDRNARRSFEGMMGAVCPEFEVRAVESAEEVAGTKSALSVAG